MDKLIRNITIVILFAAVLSDLLACWVFALEERNERREEKEKNAEEKSQGEKYQSLTDRINQLEQRIEALEKNH